MPRHISPRPRRILHREQARGKSCFCNRSAATPICPSGKCCCTGKTVVRQNMVASSFPPHTLGGSGGKQGGRRCLSPHPCTSLPLSMSLPSVPHSFSPACAASCAGNMPGEIFSQMQCRSARLPARQMPLSRKSDRSAKRYEKTCRTAGFFDLLDFLTFRVGARCLVPARVYLFCCFPPPWREPFHTLTAAGLPACGGCLQNTPGAAR